jgi:hypothetical protein
MPAAFSSSPRKQNGQSGKSVQKKGADTVTRKPVQQRKSAVAATRGGNAYGNNVVNVLGDMYGQTARNCCRTHLAKCYGIDERDVPKNDIDEYCKAYSRERVDSCGNDIFLPRHDNDKMEVLENCSLLDNNGRNDKNAYNSSYGNHTGGRGRGRGRVNSSPRTASSRSPQKRNNVSSQTVRKPRRSTR